LRNEIIKLIEEHRRKASRIPNSPKDIIWQGIPYVDILKMEKKDDCERDKKEVREEFEARKSYRHIF